MVLGVGITFSRTMVPPSLGDRFGEASGAGQCPGIVRDEHGEPVVALGGQKSRDLGADLGVVEADQHVDRAAGHIPDFHHGNAGLDQHLQCRRAVARSGDQHRIRPPAQDRAEQRLVVVVVVAADRQHHLVAGVPHGGGESDCTRPANIGWAMVGTMAATMRDFREDRPPAIRLGT